MKLRYILAAALTAGIAMAPAASAKDAADIRVYINPGHGSWGPGDRNMGTIKHGEPRNEADTLGFFESNTNLWKCLALVDRLEEYGLKLDRTANQDNPVRALQGCARDLSQNIFMSRVKNGPVPGSDEDDEAYNRSLYEISCEVQRNNFDLFISVHSNAASDDFVNYPSFFVRGEGGKASVPGSDDYSKIAWPFAFSQEHQHWTHYALERPNVIYDIDFWQGDHLISDIDGVNYKGYYGVLRHGVVGYMVEGYFHTYGPARHRAMNPDVCRDEGDSYARGVAAIFDIAAEDNGTIYGIVRDKHERFRHKYYNATAKSNDNFKPLNNVKVDLIKDDKVCATYVTDDEWNGAFVFNHLAPGTYYIAVSAEGYKQADPAECGPFEVKAAKTIYPNVWLENVDYVEPEGTLEDYADPVNSPLIKAADQYVMATVINNKQIEQLAGKTVRRVLARNGNLYVLALDEAQKPSLLVLDGNLEVIATLGTAACKGSDRDLADIQFTADGVLIGSSESITHYSNETIDPDFKDTARGSVNFYRWDNNADGVPAGEARVWFNTLASGNLYRGATANTFVYTGTVDNGTFTFPTASSYSAGRMFFNHIDVIDGEVQAFSFDNSGKNTDYLCIENLGHDYTFTLAPYDSDVFIVNAPDCPVRAFSISTLEADSDLKDLMRDEHAGAAFFKYAGHSYLAGVAQTPYLVDVTEGLDKARYTEVLIEQYAAEAVEGARLAAVGCVEADFDDEGIVKTADINCYILSGDKISKFSTRGQEQPVVAGVFAYGLNSVSSEGIYTLGFKLSGDAAARVELFADNAETVVAASKDFNAGENSVTVDANNLPAGINYNWRVVVENRPVPALAPVFTDNTTRGNGIVVNRDTESDAFGTAYYTANSTRAVYAVSPQFELSGPYADNGWDTSVGASPWRLALLPSGKLLISDWGDAHGGIYLFDPANPEQGYTNFFAGTIKPSSGEWTYEGRVIGGSTSGMSVLGKGEDTKLYTFQEDYPSDYSLTMACYNIGTNEQITAVPDRVFPGISSRLANGNVEVIATDDWMLLGQVRGAGNNTHNVPSFVIASYNDELLFNSADLTLNGSAGALALSDDKKTLYVMDASNNIRAYAIDMQNEEAPLTELYSFTPSAAGVAYQMAFDHAGNLIIAGRSALQVYTLPREACQTVTDAPSSQVVLGLSGIESVETEAVDNSAAPVEYFNLQGIRVAADNLVPGIYIRRQGSVTSKVIVR